MKPRTGICTVEAFWDTVAEIGWGTKTMTPHQVERGILESWDNAFTLSFDTMFRELRQNLADTICQFEREHNVSCDCGDDGFSDLTSHIVGLGKEVYTEEKENPMKAIRRGQRLDFTESFAYCIPVVPEPAKVTFTFEETLKGVRKGCWRDPTWDEADFEAYLKIETLNLILGAKAKMDPRYYMFRAEREILKLEKLKASSFSKEFPELDEVLTALKATASGETCSLMAEELKDKVRKLREDQEKLFVQKTREIEVLNSRGWSLDNLVGDAQKYLQSPVT